jgi:hypothetical protein
MKGTGGGKEVTYKKMNNLTQDIFGKVILL